MDYSNYIETQIPVKKKIIYIYHIRLAYKSMLEMLLCETIFINGEYFEVPKDVLLKHLTEKRYGIIKLELEKINHPLPKTYHPTNQP